MYRILVVVAALSMLSCSSDPAEEGASGRTFAYPESKRIDHVDVYHGVRVPDPYRWLEDEASPETRVWIEAQNALSQPFLESIPARERIKARMTELWNYERYDVPIVRSEEHTSELQSRENLVCRLLLETK